MVVALHSLPPRAEKKRKPNRAVRPSQTRTGLGLTFPRAQFPASTSDRGGSSPTFPFGAARRHWPRPGCRHPVTPIPTYPACLRPTQMQELPNAEAYSYAAYAIFQSDLPKSRKLYKYKLHMSVVNISVCDRFNTRASDHDDSSKTVNVFLFNATFHTYTNTSRVCHAYS